MPKCKPPETLITGVGVTTAVGQGKAEFTSALLNGRHAFSVMQRPGRQKETAFLGAEIKSLTAPEQFSRRMLRTASWSAQVALVTLQEAWEEARLDEVDPLRIGLIVGGSNVQQRELLLTFEQYGNRPEFIRPTYGVSFLDSDICGLCTEQFNIRGLAYTLGGASASGQAAILQAAHSVESGQVDVCIAIGALMDLSYLEFQAFRSVGAMGSDRFADDPALACRPFDKQRDGFLYGESCGVLVIERADTAAARGVKPYAAISGTAMTMDGNRNPNPSYEGEKRVIQQALARANLAPRGIDYINPHGTGSTLGDETEVRAILDSGLGHAYLNTTKSITGHGLTAAGAVEVIATLMQMKRGQLHPSRNLEDPIEPACNWVRDQAIPHTIQHALTMSMGFGGVNTALCLTNRTEQ